MLKKVLVIDDEKSMRTLLQDALESQSYDVEAVSNFEFAKKILEDQKVDLLITDIFMPETDGFEIIESLRTNFPSIKLIAMTGGGLFEAKDIVVKLVKEQGVDACLLKPFTVDEFLEVVQKVVS